VKITINSETIKAEKIEEVTRNDIFMYYADFFRPLTPDSYKYIALNFKDIQK
jgi:hypothetical protein